MSDKSNNFYISSTKLRNSRPEILRGLVKEWPAVSKWDDDELWLQAAGREKIVVEAYPQKKVDMRKRQLARISMDSFLKGKGETKSHKLYIAEHCLEEAQRNTRETELSSLVQDLKISSIIENSFHKKTLLFYGWNSISQSHYHPYKQLILCQIVGTKTITFHPPRTKLKMFPLLSPFFNFAECHQNGTNTTKVTLHPGDAVYIPPLWWHHVVGDKKSISVAIAWDNTSRDKIFGIRLPLRNLANQVARRLGAARHNLILEIRGFRDELRQFFRQVSW